MTLLEELRAGLPKGKLLSVAAYPPPTLLHPFKEIHWEESYFREVAQRADQCEPLEMAVAVARLVAPARLPAREQALAQVELDRGARHAGADAELAEAHGQGA